MTTATKNKIVAVVIIAAVIGLFLLGRSCGINSVLKTVGTVKTVTKDSIIYRDTGRIVPYKIETVVKGKDGETIYDTLYGAPEVRIEPVDTAAILARYYETAHYIHQIDTGRWQITVEETITENRIKDWSLKAVSSDTTTTNTVQLKPAKPLVLSFVTSLGGNVKNPFYQQGAGLMLKLPSEATYQFQIFNVKDHRPIFQLTKTWPIKLGKQ